ncbi:Methyltransferase domain-containing protein [Gaiella occulta]|uniref:Methyltransferase domain-containing protein n=1 Tax=Gaiella occulta TaxID=1002870 RepID=A0A7M2Z1T0_9ACTN|nr:class I SAM-dependent methyltransferase [Gaiella occulta]RDI76261.1 Methyltransferase domain-containing protein [Gaiella occulta]
MSATAAPDRLASGADERFVTCRRCGADDPALVVCSGDRLLGLPGGFRVVRCRRCGFLYTNPQLGEAALARHYPPEYPPYHPPPNGQAEPDGRLRAGLRAGVLEARRYPARGDGGRLRWRAAGTLASRLLSQRFVWLPPFVPGGTLVEVGSATGAYLAEMRALGWDVVGIEVDPAASATARQRHGLDVRTGTVEQAALPDGYADVVVMRMVLEHVRDPRRTLSELRRVLKPGGRLLLSVPNAGSLEARLFGSAWYGWDLPRHLSHFTPASLAALLSEAGFGRVRVRHLANANNLAGSLHYRRGGLGAPRHPGRALRVGAAVASVAHSAGRIAAEAEARPARTVICPRCGPGSVATTVLEGTDMLAGVPGVYEVVRCTRCQFLLTWPQPSSLDELAALYPPAYPNYRRGPDVGPPARLTARWRRSLQIAFLARRGYPTPDRPGRVARIAAARVRPLAPRLRRFPPYTPGGIALDVGCGPGHELAELRDHGWHVIGVELDPATAARARQEHMLDVRTGTMEDAAFEDESVDVVFFRHVLEHVSDPLATLRETRRVLRPGGRVCIEVPNAGSWEAWFFGPRWRGWELPRHLSHFTPGTLRDLLDRAGFAAAEVTHVPSGRTVVASLGLVARRPGPFWRAVRACLARAHTPLSSAVTPAAWLACVMGRSGLIWVEARRGDRSP